MFDTVSRQMASEDTYKYGDLVSMLLNQDAAELLDKKGELKVRPRLNQGRKRASTATALQDEIDRYRNV